MSCPPIVVLLNYLRDSGGLKQSLSDLVWTYIIFEYLRKVHAKPRPQVYPKSHQRSLPLTERHRLGDFRNTGRRPKQISFINWHCCTWWFLNCFGGLKDRTLGANSHKSIVHFFNWYLCFSDFIVYSLQKFIRRACLYFIWLQLERGPLNLRSVNIYICRPRTCD